MRQEVYRNTVDLTQKYAVPTAGDSNWTDVDAGTVRKFKAERSCWLKMSDGYRSQLRRLFKTSIEEDSYFDNTAGYGIPQAYYVDASYIALFEKPAHSYNSNTAFVIYLLFYGYLADLSDSNTSNIISATWPEILEYGATALGFRFAQDKEKYGEWMADAMAIYAQMVKTDQEAELAAVEEGMQPAAGQSLGARPRKDLIYWQGTDWYATV
jgi:hypothetical protein